MTKSELKYNVEKTGSNFFDHKTMKFFGDTMANYGIRETVVDTWSSGKIAVYELYRRRAVKHGLTDSAYFDKVTFDRVYAKR